MNQEPWAAKEEQDPKDSRHPVDTSAQIDIHAAKPESGEELHKKTAGSQFAENRREDRITETASDLHEGWMTVGIREKLVDFVEMGDLVPTPPRGKPIAPGFGPVVKQPGIPIGAESRTITDQHQQDRQTETSDFNGAECFTFPLEFFWVHRHEDSHKQGFW